jgi:hypothetical protein
MQSGLRVVEKNPPEKGRDLLPTDLVIVSGLQRVRKGVEVSITRTAMPVAPAAAHVPVVAAPQAPGARDKANH